MIFSQRLEVLKIGIEKGHRPWFFHPFRSQSCVKVFLKSGILLCRIPGHGNPF